MSRDERLLGLSREHHHGLVMALRLQRELPTASPAAVKALAGDLGRFWAAGLVPHFTAEQEALESILAARAGEGAAYADRMLREHHELRALMDVTRDARDTDELRDALAHFGVALGVHIRWKERELLEWMQRACSEADLDEVGARLAARLPDVPVACPTPHSL